MEFSIRGIGIIKEADIKMDGLSSLFGKKQPWPDLVAVFPLNPQPHL